MRELKSMEELKTEKSQTNCNISFDDIYRAIGYLKPEYQGVVLNNYKLPELYNIFVSYEDYEKYITGLISNATAIINIVGALTSLHKEAVMQSLEAQKRNMPGSLLQSYDNMSENEKQEFCRNILAKEDFLAESVRTIQEYFKNAVEVRKDNGGGDENGMVVEK